MSDTENMLLSVLLPAASVQFYVKDGDLLASARELSDDWRFARVVVDAVEGDVDTAIETFQHSESSDLVIIETDTTDDSFIARLEGLAEHCEEGTAAIIVGPVNDVYLYRKLVGMGVSDYLVRPIEKNVLADVIAKALIDKMGTAGSRLVALMGAKGGVGTSSLSQAVALGYAEKKAQKTMLLDAAGGWSYLSVTMGTEPISTLADAAKNAIGDDDGAFNRLIFEAAKNLSIVSSGGEIMLEEPVSSEAYEDLLDRLMGVYPHVVVDLSMASANLKKTVLHRAHDILLVSTPNLPALRAARTLMQELKDLRGGEGDEIKLIINMQGLSSANEVSKSDIETALEASPALMIPFDPKIFMTAESQAKKLSEVKGGDKIILDVMSLLTEPEGLVAETEKSKGGLGGFLDILKTK